MYDTQTCQYKTEFYRVLHQLNLVGNYTSHWDPTLNGGWGDEVITLYPSTKIPRGCTRILR